MTTDTRTQTERMWDAARDLDAFRTAGMKAVRSCEAAGTSAVHNTRNAVTHIIDAQDIVTKEASE